MVKRAIQSGVQKALKDQNRAHKSISNNRYNDIDEMNNYGNQNEISSGSGSENEDNRMKVKMKRQGNTQSKSKKEEDNFNKMRKQKSSFKSNGKFVADFTGPTGLLHARGHGQGTDKITCYAGGTYALYLRKLV